MSVKKILTAAVATMAALGIAVSVQPNGPASASRRSDRSCSPARPGVWYHHTRRHARRRYRKTYRKIRYRRHARRRVRRHVTRRRYRKHYTHKRRARRKPARKILRRASHHSNENSDNDASDSNDDSDDSSDNDNESIADKCAEAERRTLQDVNNDRIQNGLAPVQENQALDKIAAIRGPQITNAYSKFSNTSDAIIHEDPRTGYLLANEIGKNLGYNYSNTSALYEENGDASYYSGPKQAADDMNNMMMYHDGPNDSILHDGNTNNWGHRDNILDPAHKYIGIGVGYNPSNGGEYGLAEIFSNEDVGSPEYMQNMAQKKASLNSVVNNHEAPSEISFGPNGQEHDSYNTNQLNADNNEGIHTYAGN